MQYLAVLVLLLLLMLCTRGVQSIELQILSFRFFLHFFLFLFASFSVLLLSNAVHRLVCNQLNFRSPVQQNDYFLQQMIKAWELTCASQIFGPKIISHRPFMSRIFHINRPFMIKLFYYSTILII